MEKKYEVQRLRIGEDGEISEATVFSHDDIEEVMRYWNSYASGINDCNDPYFPGPFDAQCFGVRHYYRIVSR